jgi:restriction system protein
MRVQSGPLLSTNHYQRSTDGMVAEDADEAIIVTSGHFTRDAQSFAAGKPIRLLDGPALLDLVRSVQPSIPPNPQSGRNAVRRS